MFPFAEQHVSSALTGMLNGATPLFATMVASLLHRQAPSRGVAAGLVLGIGGTILIGLPAIDQGHSTVLGIVMIFAALVSYGFALSMARPLQQKYGSAPVIWRAQGVGLVLTAPFGMRDLPAIHWSAGPLLSLLALGAFGTAIAYVLMGAAVGRFGAARASASLFMIPAVALALGVVVRHEQVAPLSVAGSFVCVTGAWLMQRARTH
jgi:drug/metabolite transporter (DMT)-like permease